MLLIMVYSLYDLVSVSYRYIKQKKYYPLLQNQRLCYILPEQISHVLKHVWVQRLQLAK
jgi:hypothetical protein